MGISVRSHGQFQGLSTAQGVLSCLILITTCKVKQDNMQRVFCPRSAWSKHLNVIRHSSCHPYHCKGRSSHHEGKFRISSPWLWLNFERPHSTSELPHPWKGILTASSLSPFSHWAIVSGGHLGSLGKEAQAAITFRSASHSNLVQVPHSLFSSLGFLASGSPSHPTQIPVNLFLLVFSPVSPNPQSFYSDDFRSI